MLNLKLRVKLVTVFRLVQTTGHQRSQMQNSGRRDVHDEESAETKTSDTQERESREYVLHLLEITGSHHYL